MNIFLISDTHFGHDGPYTRFMLPDGCTPIRPHGSYQTGDEVMVENWNKTVKPTDKVYHLGDITMSTSAKSLDILGRLNGEKILIKGNHDLHKLSQYQKYFKDVRGSHQLAGMLLTHIPVHPSSLYRWTHNIHGHTHTNSVMMQDPSEYKPLEIKDPRYICVSVEQINYTPISLEDIKKHYV